ncbi:MAG: hypothetical protein CM15mP68_0040 [Pseudomonadota bacterium]|nr:MAG: hypothetical protein CM15mP68_0040 [Pseudomonadota bacterium]
MLGIVTEVTVALLPQPQQKSVILVGLMRSLAGAAVADIIAAGIIPAGMEMMDKRAVEAAEQFAHAGYPLERQLY